jgi:hypothetical protein
MPFADRDTVLDHLDTRALELEADVRRAQAEIDRIEDGTGDPATGTPYHVAEMVRLIMARTEAELTWTRNPSQRLRSGNLDPWT